MLTHRFHTHTHTQTKPTLNRESLSKKDKGKGKKKKKKRGSHNRGDELVEGSHEGPVMSLAWNALHRQARLLCLFVRFGGCAFISISHRPSGALPPAHLITNHGTPPPKQIINTQVLASGSADSAVKLWDVTTGQASATLTHHTDKVNSLQWHPLEGKS